MDSSSSAVTALRTLLAAVRGPPLIVRDVIDLQIWVREPDNGEAK